MEFAQRLYDLIDDDKRDRIRYKPRNTLGRFEKRLNDAGANDGQDMQKYSDIEFIVGPERASFYGLRFMFGLFSTWFESRLFGDDACGPRLELPDVSVEGFRAVFSLAYGLPPGITIENVMDVLETASSFNLDILVGECLAFLGQNINAGNVLSVFDAAVQQDIFTGPFEAQCCKVILKKSKQVVESDSFLKTSSLLMKKIAECDFLFVNEMRLWQRLVLWAKTRTAMDIEQQCEEEKTEIPGVDKYNVGDEVILVDGKVGTVKFKGEVHFAPGDMFGIDLKDGKGNTSGTIDDHEYFTATEENGGVFVLATRIGGFLPHVDWDNWVPKCVCGGDFAKLPVNQIYPGAGGIRCDLCKSSYNGDDQKALHCKRGKNATHPGGYDICERCENTKKIAAMKQNEILEPHPRDVKYLREVIEFVRFPNMNREYFIEKVVPLLPRPMAESVLVSFVVPTSTGFFPTGKRKNWNVGGGKPQTYEVIAANVEIEKAKKLPNEEEKAEWSRQKMEDVGPQWFIIDTAVPMNISSIGMSNYYSDNDTVKDVNLHALMPGIDYTEEEAKGDNWVAEGAFESGKTTAWQTINMETTTMSRYWKFTVMSSYGGPGNYICWDHLKVFGTKEGVQDEEDEDDDDEDVRVLEQPYEVVHASHEFEKAKKLSSRSGAAEWSGTTMQAAGGAQYFVVDLGEPNTIKKLEMQHRYQDNDTIRDIEVYYLPLGVEFNSSQRVDQGGAWVKACDIVSMQTTDVQNFDCDIAATVQARFWKFRVMSVYGGGLTAGHYPCMNYMAIFVAQPMWTTGLAKTE